MTADKISFLEQSEIRRMTRECDRVDGINLGQGICDLPTPPEVLEATSEAVLADKSVYSPYEGQPVLREQLAAKLRDYNGLDRLNVDDGMVVTIGSTGAFACVVQGLLNPGDEVIMFEPYYGYHLNTLRVGGCSPSFVTLSPPDWEFSFADLEAALTPKTRAIVVNTPTNPSGKVFGRDELEVIAEFCREHDILAITDEIYEYIIYDGVEHVSLASLPGMWERTVTISGFSKTFAITGWRIGYAAGPAELIEPLGLVNDLFYVCAPTPLQYGVAGGMARLDDDYYEEMAHDYEAKRDFFCDALAACGLTPYVPAGAYYVLADVEPFGFDTSKEAAMHILEEAGVASVPGSAFYVSETGESLTRFCYAKEWDVLEAAADRLGDLQ